MTRHIVIILDRSGSMEKVRADIEGGLCAFLREQQAAPGATTVSLYQFDDHYEAVYENEPLEQTPAFTLEPRGRTALFDAVGRTLRAVGTQIAAEPAADRRGEVVIVILTDGHDNASRRYSRTAVRDLITLRQEAGWRFVFLGADQDAFAAAEGMGIGRDTTLTYASDHTRDTLGHTGRMIVRGGETGAYAFTEKERDQTG